MDLHRAAFKMENSPYLPNPLASPALMVLASTAEASRDASIPCQQPRPFGVPVSADKDVHIPFTNGSYTFASMYHRQGGVPGAFANRDFPPSLLHLHPQFAPPNLDCTPISMLNHSGVGAFRPFASTEDRESYQSAFTPAKRLKNCHDTDSPHLRFSDADGKEYEFGTQLPSSSPGSLKVDETGKKIFAVSGLISDRETSSSPEERSDRYRSDNQRGPQASATATHRMILTLPLCNCHTGLRAPLRRRRRPRVRRSAWVPVASPPGYLCLARGPPSICACVLAPAGCKYCQCVGEVERFMAQ
ncbi:PREDICTED: E3 ubiquitin-protein ligase RNF220, partial [Tinamus guttatus]|uniref:E3 ubiquitin-protein ligase RNF220 n=1 Tax=Tinamus guttatus TaxID=94827 RepID=UPI00052EB65F